MNKNETCFECGSKASLFFGYYICESCKSKLGLFTMPTIQKHIELYKTSKPLTYKEEIESRLLLIEKDFIKKKIKLLHILSQI